MTEFYTFINICIHSFIHPLILDPDYKFAIVHINIQYLCDMLTWIPSDTCLQAVQLGYMGVIFGDLG